MTQTSAPGKIVLWGEYAVLAGAPAGVLALNTSANVTAAPSPDNRWHFSSAGFKANPASCKPEELPEHPAAGFVKAILEHWAVTALHQCANPMSIHTDTSAFFTGSQKLGLGSSAAVCTAMYLLLCELTGREAMQTEAMAIHKHWQGGKGSGLDIASVWHGGLIHFQDGVATRATLPADLHWQVIFSGRSAGTKDHIASFDAWRKKSSTRPLDDLVKASTDLYNGSLSLADLARYGEVLKAFDEAANLNIFTQAHTRLGTLAAAAGVLYKPCGAGGGDIGIGFSDDPGALAVFQRKAADDGFLTLDLEMDPHGAALKHG